MTDLIVRLLHIQNLIFRLKHANRRDKRTKSRQTICNCSSMQSKTPFIIPSPSHAQFVSKKSKWDREWFYANVCTSFVGKLAYCLLRQHEKVAILYESV